MESSKPTQGRVFYVRVQEMLSVDAFVPRLKPIEVHRSVGAVVNRSPLRISTANLVAAPGDFELRRSARARCSLSGQLLSGGILLEGRRKPFQRLIGTVEANKSLDVHRVAQVPVNGALEKNVLFGSTLSESVKEDKSKQAHVLGGLNPVALRRSVKHRCRDTRVTHPIAVVVFFEWCQCLAGDGSLGAVIKGNTLGVAVLEAGKPTHPELCSAGMAPDTSRQPLQWCAMPVRLPGRWERAGLHGQNKQDDTRHPS
jgi:hypothetical protein